MKNLVSTLFLLFSLVFSLQAQLKTDWFNEEFNRENGGGIAADAAAELLQKKELQPVIVAVIDDGVDIEHPDLQGKIWVNEDEIPSNGKDDDGNGFIDDVHGWNFLGNPDGDNVKYETLEITRLYRQYATRFEGKSAESINKDERKEYRRFLAYKSDFDARVTEVKTEFSEFARLAAMYRGAQGYVLERLDADSLTPQALDSFQPETDDDLQVKNFLLLAEREGLESYLVDGEEYFTRYLEYNLNPDYDPRGMVNESEMPEGYGNSQVDAESPEHGTHVAGIIAAVRDNGVGIDGIANNAVIMPIRAVPAGDERDKDIARAIRYAVDNGAKIINTSFGKSYSPERELVFEAMRHASKNDVLIIHAAGNDGSDNDVEINYPDGTMGKKKTAINWLTVAAINYRTDSTFLADFSNYGRRSVDILAPGVEIRSLTPDAGTKSQSGTSMAAPVVSGVAALIRGLDPDLSAKKVKKLLIQSGIPAGEVGIERDGRSLKLEDAVRNPVVVSAENAVNVLLGED
jgi:subtilisin family serine protease